ncbi:hypothetical protein HPB51_014251 [Rhipicephalus microplus]|uniref:Uncharacterized protein n=1 Tax=Rhipicephalus microplus TaxID=6941 RepID=A0A9J6D5G3_RHIMP|nr:hypothetical protein HPB51_014251 [Rhipicephalus microplus]
MMSHQLAQLSTLLSRVHTVGEQMLPDRRKESPSLCFTGLRDMQPRRFSEHPQPTFYLGDFTSVDVDPGTDFFHTEKAEELPSKSYERQIDRTSTAQHPSRTSSDPRTSPHRILQVAEKEKLPRLNFPLCFKSRLKAKPS